MDWPKQVILVSPFFFPELISTGKANQFLAEALVAEGHGVTVVCSHPLYPAWVPRRSDAGLAGTRILRGGGWLRYPPMPLRRMVLEAWFALYASRRMWRLRKSADVVVSVLPPSLFACVLDRLLPRKVRRVAVIHDLQGVLAAQKTSVARRAIIRTIHAVENRTLRAQDLCIFFSRDMATVARTSYGLDPQRIAVQYPFITLTPEGADGSGDAQARLETVLPWGTTHVVYSGALGDKQNSQQLVSLMQAAAQRYPEAQFHVFSGGPLFDAIRASHSSATGPRVQFHPLVEQRDLAALYARSAIQVVPQAERTEIAALPSKLPNLLAAGVHLLAICGEGSEVERLVREAGTGTVVERWDKDLFLERVGEALEVVAKESAAERRTRTGSVLERFSVGRMVRMILARGAPVGTAGGGAADAALERERKTVLVGSDHEG